VHRHEVYEAVCAANRSAATAGMEALASFGGRLRLQPPREPVA
jgi:hypothetical protein